MVAINPDALSARDLVRYVRFVEGNGQNAERWRHALWIKLAYPLAAAVKRGFCGYGDSRVRRRTCTTC